MIPESDNKLVKVGEIAETFEMSEEIVLKLCTRGMPHLPNVDQKRIRQRCSQESLNRFNRHQTDLVRMRQPPQRARNKTVKRKQSITFTGEVMASIFEDAKGISPFDYLNNGKTITDEYYFNVVDQLPTSQNSREEALSRKNHSMSTGHMQARWKNCVISALICLAPQNSICPNLKKFMKMARIR